MKEFNWTITNKDLIKKSRTFKLFKHMSNSQYLIDNAKSTFLICKILQNTRGIKNIQHNQSHVKSNEWDYSIIYGPIKSLKIQKRSIKVNDEVTLTYATSESL